MGIFREGHPERHPLMTGLAAIANGEKTLAQLEGITFAEAWKIAQMGCELAAAGKTREALVVFEGLTALNPNDGAAHAALGTLYQSMGRNDEALAAYDQALKVDAKSPVARLYRGQLRLGREDPGGQADLEMVSKGDPQGRTLAGKQAKAWLRAMALAAQANQNSL